MPADSSSKAATAAGPALRSRTRSPRSTISHPSPVTTAGFWRPTSKPGLGSALPTGPGRCAAGTCTGPADADEAGARVLRDLAAGPSQISAVSAWLRPGHFSRAGHGELYDVMRDLADAGQSVDPVTVRGEASRRGIEADAADLAGGMAPFAVASARECTGEDFSAKSPAQGRTSRQPPRTSDPLQGWSCAQPTNCFAASRSTGARAPGSPPAQRQG